MNIAVVGAGLIGRAHIDVVSLLPDARLCAIVDPSDAARDLAGRLGVVCLASLDELLAIEDPSVRPDAVVLATPNAWHVPQAMACIQAGWPVLVEKPIAADVTEAHQLVDAVERLGARVLIGHHRAHSPLMAKARQVIESGQLGRLVTVSGSATFYKPDDYFEQGPWRRQPGGGPILINLIHEIHNLRLLCGEIDSVQAMASHAVRGFPVEDTVVINLRFASGALGTFVLSDTAASPRSWEQTTGENPAYPRSTDEDCYVLSGTNGTLSVPTMRLKTYPRREDRSWWKPFEAGQVGWVPEDPLMRQMRHFLQLARGECEPLVNARDGLANLIVTEAIVEAARTGQTVSIPCGRRDDVSLF